MFLAKLEINKNSTTDQERATLVVFDRLGDPFLKMGMEGFEKRFNILSPFNYHGDTYFFIGEK